MIRYVLIGICMLSSCNNAQPPEQKENIDKLEENMSNKWDPPKDLDGYQIASTGPFVTRQKTFSRVRKAYQSKGPYLAWLLKQEGIISNKLELYFQAFKKEDLFLVWAKNESDRQFKLLKKYTICKKSGKLGPKRKEGDRQVPEGFYHIDLLNPSSSYHLSLHVNYPNPSDLILSDQERPGGLIYIHGKCATIGCLPMQDGPIEELYVLCTEAMNNGQKTIPITIFPFVPNDENLSIESKGEPRTTQLLWNDLKEGYNYFEKNKTLPKIKFNHNGRSQIED